MSNYTIYYRGNLRGVRLDGGISDWTCQHNHKTVDAAARCSQIAARRHLPNTRSKTAHTRFESISCSVMVDDSRLGGPMSLSSYRIYAAPGIP